MTQPDRRDLLLAFFALPMLGAATPVPALADPSPAAPGQFDWLTGEWRIANRRQKSPGEWDEYPGEATCWSILGGRAHVEELRIPARDFSGMGLRSFDPEQGVWLDYWMNAKIGVAGGEGTPGRFIDGEGIFDAADTDAQGPVIWRGMWDQITGRSHRWRQGISRDAGATWDWGWIMDWTKV